MNRCKPARQPVKSRVLNDSKYNEDEREGLIRSRMAP